MIINNRSNILEHWLRICETASDKDFKYASLATWALIFLKFYCHSRMKTKPKDSHNKVFPSIYSWIISQFWLNEHYYLTKKCEFVLELKISESNVLEKQILNISMRINQVDIGWTVECILKFPLDNEAN